MRTRFTVGIMSVVVVLSCLSPTSAALLVPGATLWPAPGEADPVPGVVVGDTGLVPFVAATFTGNLRTVVIAGDASNLLGGLTFAYQVTNNAASLNDIGRLTVLDFTGWLTDASWQLGVGRAPALINRATADVVGFNFIGAPLGTGTLSPGLTSTWLVVQTDAPQFTQTVASVIDGSVAMVASYGPIPEPATLGLLGLGLSCLSRRRPRHS